MSWHYDSCCRAKLLLHSLLPHTLSVPTYTHVHQVHKYTLNILTTHDRRRRQALSLCICVYLSPVIWWEWKSVCCYTYNSSIPWQCSILLRTVFPTESDFNRGNIYMQWIVSFRGICTVKITQKMCLSAAKLYLPQSLALNFLCRYK